MRDEVDLCYSVIIIKFTASFGFRLFEGFCVCCLVYVAGFELRKVNRIWFVYAVVINLVELVCHEKKCV